MSHSTHVHLMDPDTHIGYEDLGARRSVEIEAGGDVRVTITLADPGDPFGITIFADAIKIAEQLEATADAIRQAYGPTLTVDLGDHYIRAAS